MFLRYLTALTQSPDGLLHKGSEDAGDAGASTAKGDAGGSQPREELANDDDADAGSSHEDTPPAESDDDDILVADEDFSDVPFHEHPRFKAVTSKLKKVARQNSRLRSNADRYRGVDLDTLRTRAAVAEQLEGLFGRNRALHKQVLDAMAAGDQPAAAEQDFDPSKLPFDVNDEVGKYFVEQHKVIQRLQKQLEGVTNTQASTERKSYEKSWQAATESASKELPEHVQDVFQDAMYGAYRVALADGKRVNPQTFVNQYLGKLKARGIITGKAAARSSAAASQRIAENNKQLPRQPAGGGQPASSRSKNENVTDVNRRLKQMWRSA